LFGFFPEDESKKCEETKDLIQVVMTLRGTTANKDKRGQVWHYHI
jgi:hypothetical protein